MVQVSHTREGAVVVGDSITVTCECDWTGEVTVYDVGDGPEWACPSCDFAYTLTAGVQVNENGLTPAMAQAKAKVDEMMRLRLEGHSMGQAAKMVGL